MNDQATTGSRTTIGAKQKHPRAVTQSAAAGRAMGVSILQQRRAAHKLHAATRNIVSVPENRIPIVGGSLSASIAIDAAYQRPQKFWAKLNGIKQRYGARLKEAVPLLNAHIQRQPPGSFVVLKKNIVLCIQAFKLTPTSPVNPIYTFDRLDQMALFIDKVIAMVKEESSPGSILRKPLRSLEPTMHDAVSKRLYRNTESATTATPTGFNREMRELYATVSRDGPVAIKSNAALVSSRIGDATIRHQLSKARNLGAPIPPESIFLSGTPENFHIGGDRQSSTGGLLDPFCKNFPAFPILEEWIGALFLVELHKISVEFERKWQADAVLRPTEHDITMPQAQQRLRDAQDGEVIEVPVSNPGLRTWGSTEKGSHRQVRADSHAGMSQKQFRGSGKKAAVRVVGEMASLGSTGTVEISPFEASQETTTGRKRIRSAEPHADSRRSTQRRRRSP
eukprot:IDg14158t1